jgi:small subunit ribosomal protein S9
MSEKSKHVQSAGKRKSAIARATLKFPAKGQIKINEVLEVITHPKLEKCDISVKVQGGGVMSQTDAVRIAIAKAINKFIGTKTIEKSFREYDESLLSGDSRRTEPKHFGGRKARARRQKSFR